MSMPAGAKLPFEARAFQHFVRGLRGVWREEAYRGAVDAARASGAAEPAQIEGAAARDPAYRLYAWLERYSQQFKYYGRWGIVRWMESHEEDLAAILAAARVRHPERLVLDPALPLPDYVRDVDTHQHAGGLWSDACDAFAYETSSSAYSFSLLDPKSPHAIYAEAAQALVPDAQRVADLGCTSGSSTRTLARAFPQAEVTGCDVCAPPLMLAHLRALEEGLTVYWRQASAERLPWDAASVDLVASHWLYHEMPPRAVRAALREARRVLRPGGGFLAYDMYLVPGGAIGRWLHAGYAARNNEPFAHTYARMDMRAELEAAGFRDIDIRLAYPPPDEATAAGGLPAARTHYMTMISALA